MERPTKTRSSEGVLSPGTMLKVICVKKEILHRKHTTSKYCSNVCSLRNYQVLGPSLSCYIIAIIILIITMSAIILNIKDKQLFTLSQKQQYRKNRDLSKFLQFTIAAFFYYHHNHHYSDRCTFFAGHQYKNPRILCLLCQHPTIIRYPLFHGDDFRIMFVTETILFAINPHK